jgi:hypothetical protein
MPPKLVALIVAAALTTGWLLASIVSPPVAELQGLPDRVERRAPSRATSSEAPLTEQLHLKLRTAPAPPVPRRNPFVFGDATRRVDARESESPAAAGRPVFDHEPAPVATGPSLRLSGIGSTKTESGAVRTAIVSDGTTVHLVKTGETVMGYAVIEITDDAVTLADAAGRLVLRLK